MFNEQHEITLENKFVDCELKFNIKIENVTQESNGDDSVTLRYNKMELQPLSTIFLNGNSYVTIQDEGRTFKQHLNSYDVKKKNRLVRPSDNQYPSEYLAPEDLDGKSI